MRATVYFFAAFLPALVAGIQEQMDGTAWVKALAMAATSGIVAIRGLLDNSAAGKDGGK